MYENIKCYWQELAYVMQDMPFSQLTEVAEELLDCWRRGNTIFLLGNGGSAATASHFACDLAKGTRTPGLPAFRAIALNDNIPLMTAWSNDICYERVFAEQLLGLVRSGDVVILISASGNSPNVLAAARAAQQADALTIALTGQSGGQLRKLADLVVRVPSQSIEQVEDAHMMIAHSLCVTLRRNLQEMMTIPEVEPGALQERVAETAVVERG